MTRGELCALKALEEIFPGQTFVKVRPDWLQNDQGSKRPLEIDLYSHALRLGLEHSGLAHFCFPNSLHKTRDEFDSQVARDSLKRELCAKAGVCLIVVPFTVKHADMKQYILSELERCSDNNDYVELP
jgi:hypothetical protein